MLLAVTLTYTHQHVSIWFIYLLLLNSLSAVTVGMGYFLNALTKLLQNCHSFLLL